VSRYQGFLFDLDGTLYVDEQVIPGAPQTIAYLRRQGAQVAFVSNKPLATRAEYAAKLTRLGIPTRPDEIIHSSMVLIRYLRREMPGATVYPIGEAPLIQELQAAGFRISEDPAEVQAVIASFDRTFTYRKLDIAFQALRRGARFLATNADPTCPVRGGEIPDAGAVIGALEGCSRRRVEWVAGKPSLLITEIALERLGVPAERCLLVGDRLETDILMGHRAGMGTALVLSGVSREEDLKHAPVQPDYVLPSVAALPEIL